MFARFLLSGALISALSGPVFAQNSDSQVGLRQSEWKETFDAGSTARRPVVTNSAILSYQTIPAMEQAIFLYQDLAARGGWNFVPADTQLRLGMQHPNVTALRRRLVTSGDLRQTQGAGESFDSYVREAVIRFQKRHGLPADGVVGTGTLRALNVPVETRLIQLTVNLERIKEKGIPENRYILVNVPGAQIEAVEAGHVVSRHTAVVGKVDRQTPILSSKIHQINFNPFWTVPKSIIRRDLIPTMQEEPNYLNDNRIRIYTQAGDEIFPEQVDWTTDEAVDYMFRQDPGDQNSLGSIRMNFHNPHAVFLHDTPSKGLFGSDYRFESSGCVRVHNVRELVSWILQGNGYDRALVDATIRSGERLDVEVTEMPELHLAYFTAWTTGDGTVHFREDIYGLDTAGTVALNQPTELIGSPTLAQ